MFISFGIWMVHNLSQDYSDIVSVQIIARSELEGYSQNSNPTTISARCRASGFKLSYLQRMSSKPKVILIDRADFSRVESDIFSVPTSFLYKYTEQIFGNSVMIESFVSGDPVFRFTPENSKKVPVMLVHTISYKPQYMPVDAITVVPDSVYVYGDPKLIDSIDKVLSKPVTLGDIGSDISGEVRLERIKGVRLSDQKVDYHIDVQRYVELSDVATIKVKGAPDGVSVMVYPSVVNVTFNCEFPLRGDPRTALEFYIDFEEFLNSRTGCCMIRQHGDCKGLISATLQPEFCDCFVLVD